MPVWEAGWPVYVWWRISPSPCHVILSDTDGWEDAADSVCLSVRISFRQFTRRVSIRASVCPPVRPSASLFAGRIHIYVYLSVLSNCLSDYMSVLWSGCLHIYNRRPKNATTSFETSPFTSVICTNSKNEKKKTFPGTYFLWQSQHNAADKYPSLR